MHLHLAFSSVLLLAACAPKSADSDDGTGSSAADTEGAEATSATGTPTTGDDPTVPPQMSAGTAPDPSTSTSTSTSTSATSADTSATNTVTTEVPDTGDDTGGGSLPDACEAVCTHWDMCKPGVVGPVPECIASCVEDFGEEPGCALAITNQWDCVAGLSCEEALKFIESSPTSCLNEVQATDEACSVLDCGGEVGGDDMTCEFQQQCGDVTQAFVCDLEVCTCEETGLPDKECASDGFCMLNPPEQRAKVKECCGWDWDLPSG
jgi:hypothetical protein